MRAEGAKGGSLLEVRSALSSCIVAIRSEAKRIRPNHSSDQPCGPHRQDTRPDPEVGRRYDAQEAGGSTGGDARIYSAAIRIMTMAIIVTNHAALLRVSPIARFEGQLELTVKGCEIEMIRFAGTTRKIESKCKGQAILLDPLFFSSHQKKLYIPCRETDDRAVRSCLLSVFSNMESHPI